MANRNYHCIQDDGSHLFGIRRKARHHREQNSKYFMLASYGEQYSWGLHVLERTNTATSSLKYDISMKCIVITYHLA